MKLVILSSVCFFLAPLAANAGKIGIVDEPDKNLCSFDSVVSLRGDSPQVCEALAKEFMKGKFEPCAMVDSWMSYIAQAKGKCIEDATKALFDKRVKSLDGKTRDVERKMHDRFAALMQAQCDLYAQCGGTAALLMYESCLNNFRKFRFDQIGQMEKQALPSTPALSSETYPAKLSKALNAYTQVVCQLSDKTWAGGKRPSECVKRAESQLKERQLLDASPCDAH